MSFASTKAKAEAVDTPVLAIQIWQTFIDSKPSAADLTLANTELDKWQKLEKSGAEKINGKWVGGDEKKELLKKVKEMVKEGYKAVEGDQSLEGMKKLEDALKLYPNNFELNYLLGYFYLVKGAVGPNGHGNIVYQEKAVKSLEIATKLNPTCAALEQSCDLLQLSRALRRLGAGSVQSGEDRGFEIHRGESRRRLCVCAAGHATEQ